MRPSAGVCVDRPGHAIKSDVYFQVAFEISNRLLKLSCRWDHDVSNHGLNVNELFNIARVDRRHVVKEQARRGFDGSAGHWRVRQRQFSMLTAHWRHDEKQNLSNKGASDRSGIERWNPIKPVVVSQHPTQPIERQP